MYNTDENESTLTIEEIKQDISNIPVVKKAVKKKPAVNSDAVRTAIKKAVKKVAAKKHAVKKVAKKKAITKKEETPVRKISNKINGKFKAHLLASDLLAKRASKSLSYNDIAEATGLSAPIIHRAASKEGISIDSLVSLANYLHHRIERYF